MQMQMQMQISRAERIATPAYGLRGFRFAR
jgi:hypothetical protein